MFLLLPPSSVGPEYSRELISVVIPEGACPAGKYVNYVPRMALVPFKVYLKHNLTHFEPYIIINFENYVKARAFGPFR